MPFKERQDGQTQFFKNRASLRVMSVSMRQRLDAESSQCP